MSKHPLIEARNKMIANGWTLICASITAERKGGFTMLHEETRTRFFLSNDTIASIPVI